MRLQIFAIALALLMANPGQGREADHLQPAHKAVSAHSAARTTLLGHITVRGEALTLASLLPDSAPNVLRAEAGKISLGDAPQPPMTRIIYRQQLQYLLRDHEPLLSELQVPSQIAVQRFHRAITNGEVVAAIDRALDGKGPATLRDARLSAPVYVTGNDAGLRVIRIESDPLRHETRFTLRTFKDPGNLPFTVAIPEIVKLPTLVSRHALAPGEIVTASDFETVMEARQEKLQGLPTGSTELSGLETRAHLRSGQPINRSDFAKPVLVRPEALATLILQGDGFSIKTIVTPLEQGVLGQEIKVRNTETRQVVEAKVVGRDKLLKHS